VCAGTAYALYRKHNVPGSAPWLPATNSKTPQPVVDLPMIPRSATIGTSQAMAVDGGTFTKLGNFVHHYSRRQAWNSNESLILSLSGHVYTEEGELFVAHDTISAEAVWSNTDPHTIFAVQNIDGVENRFVKWNVKTNHIDLLFAFDNLTDLSIGEGEGTVSNDDKHIVLFGREDGEAVILSIDLAERQVLGKITAKDDFNWAGVSQLGAWVVVENNARDSEETPQLLRYTLDLTEETVLFERPNHGDFCLDADGNEVYAMTARYFEWVNLNSTTTYRHGSEPKMYGHVSCRNLDRPGWAYVSLLESPGLIGAIPIVPQFKHWEPWGLHYSSYTHYSVQPKASVSRSGTKVIFTSDMNPGADTKLEPMSYSYTLDTDSITERDWYD